MNRFWMVVVPGTRGPSFIHHTKISAILEARRLVQDVGCAKAVVLEAVDGFERAAPVPPPVTQITFTNSPPTLGQILAEKLERDHSRSQGVGDITA